MGVMLAQQVVKPLAVLGLKKVAQLMNDDVLQQVFRLFHQVQVEANIALMWGTATPLALEFLYEKRLHGDAQNLLPLTNKRGQFCPQNTTMPVISIQEKTL